MGTDEYSGGPNMEVFLKAGPPKEPEAIEIVSGEAVMMVLRTLRRYCQDAETCDNCPMQYQAGGLTGCGLNDTPAWWRLEYTKLGKDLPK